jgi:predicted transglutaminase-like cysteine proteinase
MRTTTTVTLILIATSAQAFTSHLNSGTRMGAQRQWAAQYPRESGVTFGGGYGRGTSLRFSNRQATATASRSTGTYQVSQTATTAASRACQTVQQRVTYRSDVQATDEWRSGEETLASGWGDCEDMAAAVKSVCHTRGITSNIYIVRARALRAGHAITIGGSEGRMWMSSNGSYRDIRSIDDARQIIAREFGWKNVKVTIHRHTPKP